MNPTEVTGAESSSPLTFADGRRRGNWSWFSNAVLDAPVSGPARFCYLVLCRYADGEGASWPSIARLAADQKCSRSRVKMSLRELEKAGLLEIQIRDPRQTNVYVLKTPPGHLVAPRSPGDPTPVTTCPTPGYLVTTEVDSLKKTKEEETGADAPGPEPVKSKGNGHPGVALFCDEYFATKRKPYLVTGRDAKALKELWDNLGEPEFRSRLPRFLALTDPFIAERQHAAWLFPTRVNELGGAPAPQRPPMVSFDEQKRAAEAEKARRGAGGSLEESRAAQERYEAAETERRRKMLGLPEGATREQTEQAYQVWLDSQGPGRR